MPSGYEVSIDGGTPIDVGNNLFYNATGLTPFQEYSFKVRAYDAQGVRSSWSPIIYATPVPYVLSAGDIVTVNGDPVYVS